VAVKGPRCSFLGRPTMRALSRLCVQTPSVSAQARIDGLLHADGPTYVMGAVSLTGREDLDWLEPR
jgi:hypothetical protein